MTDQMRTPPGWEGSVGPWPNQYVRRTYARDIQSGAGNCVCGSSLRDPVHLQAAPGIEIPGALEQLMADPPAHLISDTTDRGFMHLPTLQTGRAGRFVVYESSSAEQPRIWLEVNGDPAHLTVREAWKLVEQLALCCKLHYQGEGLPEDRVFDLVVRPLPAKSGSVLPRCPTCGTTNFRKWDQQQQSGICLNKHMVMVDHQGQLYDPNGASTGPAEPTG